MAANGFDINFSFDILPHNFHIHINTGIYIQYYLVMYYMYINKFNYKICSIIITIIYSIIYYNEIIKKEKQWTQI